MAVDPRFIGGTTFTDGGEDLLARARRERQQRIHDKWQEATEALLDQIIACAKPGAQMNEGVGDAVAGYGQCLGAMMVAVAEQQRRR